MKKYLIDPSGVEKVDTQVKRRSDGFQRLFFLSITIEVSVESGHALFRRKGEVLGGAPLIQGGWKFLNSYHASKTLGGGYQTLTTKCSLGNDRHYYDQYDLKYLLLI